MLAHSCLRYLSGYSVHNTILRADTPPYYLGAIPSDSHYRLPLFQRYAKPRTPLLVEVCLLPVDKLQHLDSHNLTLGLVFYFN